MKTVKKKIEYYIVKVERPKGVTEKQMKYYLLDAINTWNGCYDPSNDPLFGFKCESVKVIK